MKLKSVQVSSGPCIPEKMELQKNGDWMVMKHNWKIGKFSEDLSLPIFFIFRVDVLTQFRVGKWSFLRLCRWHTSITVIDPFNLIRSWFRTNYVWTDLRGRTLMITKARKADMLWLLSSTFLRISVLRRSKKPRRQCFCQVHDAMLIVHNAK